MIVLYAGVVILFSSLLPLIPEAPYIFGIMIAVLVILSSFLSLHVSVDQTHVKLKFGYGIFKKTFLRKEIKSAKAVRNPWYFGWGIHYWPFRPMWIYNVSGFDAVELIMKNGKVFRIGSDEAQKLAKAIHE
jgi:hypothetical protein